MEEDAENNLFGDLSVDADDFASPDSDHNKYNEKTIARFARRQEQKSKPEDQKEKVPRPSGREPRESDKFGNSFWRLKSDDGKGSEWKDAFWRYCKDDDTKDTDGIEEETEKSWKEVSWDVAREEVAKQFEESTHTVDTQVREQYEDQAGDYWEKFYVKNQGKFFRDRHYLGYQFPILRRGENEESRSKNWKIMEVGCGTGCTLYPLLESHPDSNYYVFDFSAQAVQVLKENEKYDEKKVKAFVLDANKDPSPEFIEDGSLDLIIMVFVSSAINPDDMKNMLTKLKKALKPGGLFLVRDYGSYDMTHVRFMYKEGRKLGDKYYVRADGTRVVYFTPETSEKLFVESGYTGKATFDTRELRNRKKMINMYRVWINGEFINTP